MGNEGGNPPVLIVLGDSMNDIKMLRQADVSCVIPNEKVNA